MKSPPPHHPSLAAPVKLGCDGPGHIHGYDAKATDVDISLLLAKFKWSNTDKIDRGKLAIST